MKEKEKRKKGKMDSKQELKQKIAGTGPLFIKMKIPRAFHGDPCCVVHDEGRKKELEELIKLAAAKRKEAKG